MRKLIALLLFHSFIYQSFAQTNAQLAKELTGELEQVYSQGHIVGFSVAIVNQDGVLYEKGFGYATQKTNRTYTANTIQNIASISKTFIGVALLKAQELGKLNLDDPINTYLPYEVLNPDFPEIPITIRHLATHTSSIKDPARYEKNGYVLKEQANGEAKVNPNFRPANEMMTQAEFLEKILSNTGDWYKKSTFLKTQPGERFEYSNIAAGLAAIVLENATGEAFNDFTKKHIFEPLEMSSSGWFFDEVDLSMHSSLYSKNKIELAFYRLVNYPDGGLITSSNDLGKYLTEMISGYGGNGTILSDESYQMLFHPSLTDENYTERSESAYNDEYNMGVFMGISATGQIGHTGGDPGVATFMFFNPETQVGKILFVNTDLGKEGTKEFIEIWKKLIAFEAKF